MNDKKAPIGAADRVLKFFASVRLTVVLLLVLAATSIIGTLIPQNADPNEYLRAFGEVFFRIFTAVGLFDMYHSWWFRILILLLTLNIIVCSLERWGGLWKIAFPKGKRFKPSRFERLKDIEEVVNQRPPGEMTKEIEAFVAKSYRYTQVEPHGRGRIVFGERWRWTRLGVFVVHLSIIFMLAGALIGSLFGFEGFVNIPEGESARAIRMFNANKMIQLPFEIRCDDFDVRFYPNGAPQEFRSDLVILKAGKPVYKKSIIVNDPLRYDGINIFQSSYGELAPQPEPRSEIANPENVVLNMVVSESGMSYQLKAKIGETITLPEGMGNLEISKFEPQATFGGQKIGEALLGTLTPTDADPVTLMLPIRFPNFDKMRRGKIVLSVLEPRGTGDMPLKSGPKRYYTGLQVTKDPGVWVVYCGFTLMILGCIITFFMSHQQIYIVITPKGKNRSRLQIGGYSYRNKLAMQVKITRIAQRLSSPDDAGDQSGG